MAALTVGNPISASNFGGNALDAGTSHCGYQLQRCIQLNSLAQGKAVHARIIKLGLEIEIFLGNCLVNMYAKCGNMKDARKMFDNMAEQNLVSWNVIIAGYAQEGFEEEALELFEEMQLAKMVPNEFTFGSVLKACATREALEEGKQVHCFIVKLGFEQNLFLGSALIDMYSKCSSIRDAYQTFAKISQRNVVSWNAIIAASIQHGWVKQALEFFAEMQLAGIKASHVTFGLVLNASAILGNLEQGKQLHACVFRNGFGSDLLVGSSVILMYIKCGNIDDARQVFDKMPMVDLGLFNATIQGYSSEGHNNEAMELFGQLLRTGLKPNDITFTIVLRACASFETALEQGRQLHVQIMKSVFQHNVSVVSSLITVYAKSGCIADAQKVFDKMTVQNNVVLWTALIAGYSQKGYTDEALKLFLLMQRAGVKPNQFTYPTVLRACANLASIEEGKQVHCHIIKAGAASDTFVASAIVDMYIKCGSLEDGQRGFDRIPKRDIVSWNTMIAGYARHGYVDKALLIFEEMQQYGVKPNHVTFVAVLSACSHGGLVRLGRRYFNSLSRTHGIIPRMEHYACIVDLLGRVGHLYEAEDFINNMPFEPSALVWETLLQACRIHGNMEVAKRAELALACRK